MKVARTVWTYTKSDWIVRDGLEFYFASAVNLSVNDDPYQDEFTSEDDQNYYKFNTEDGETYYIITDMADDYTPDTYIYLYDSEFNVIDEDDDDGAAGYESLIAFTSDGGTYYVMVEEYDYPNGAIGEYTIKVTTSYP